MCMYILVDVYNLAIYTVHHRPFVNMVCSKTLKNKIIL